MFLLYSPLNQGLKPGCAERKDATSNKFLLYSPLNQGLKLDSFLIYSVINYVFTLQSIKSRIETNTDSNLSPEEQPGFYSTVH